MEIKIPKGVLSASQAAKVFEQAKEHLFALPAVNVSSTSTINAVLETAKEVNSPVIIQLSHGGASFYAGKSLSNDGNKASIVGAISAAHHVHVMAEAYGVSVILHTDHAAKKLLGWIDALLEEGERYYKVHKKPLFTSHMLDLSEESLQENIETCKKYLTKMTALNMLLEVELGITGGEEDGVDNTKVDSKKFYTTPEDVNEMYQSLDKISANFTVAAAFGNVHGVYKPGNVKLTPGILKDTQEHVATKHNLSKNPINFVFHGGSGSSEAEIKETLDYGVVKMNIDTDLQWALWDGVKNFYKSKEAYLQTQIGNPDGADKPNKQYYDPRNWLRHGEKTFVERLKKGFEELNAVDVNRFLV